MRTILFFAFLLTMISCFEQGDCSDFSSNVMQVNFYSHSDKKAKTILVDSVKMVGWDTVMHKNASVSLIKLPLNPAMDTMTYNLYYENKVASLGIKYTTRTYALAPGCSAIDILVLTDAASPIVQSLKISQSNLTSNVVENIKLYF